MVIEWIVCQCLIFEELSVELWWESICGCIRIFWRWLRWRWHQWPQLLHLSKFNPLLMGNRKIFPWKRGNLPNLEILWVLHWSEVHSGEKYSKTWVEKRNEVQVVSYWLSEASKQLWNMRQSCYWRICLFWFWKKNTAPTKQSCVWCFPLQFAFSPHLSDLLTNQSCLVYLYWYLDIKLKHWTINYIFVYILCICTWFTKEALVPISYFSIFNQTFAIN